MNSYFIKSFLDEQQIDTIPFIFDCCAQNDIIIPLLQSGLQIHDSNDLYAIFMHYWSIETIETRMDYMVIYFKNRNIIGVTREAISENGILSCNIDSQTKHIHLLGATEIATAYNLYNSEIKPSIASLKHFINNYEHFKSLGIKYYDHIIINDRKKGPYYSLMKTGLF